MTDKSMGDEQKCFRKRREHMGQALALKTIIGKYKTKEKKSLLFSCFSKYLQQERQEGFVGMSRECMVKRVLR